MVKHLCFCAALLMVSCSTDSGSDGSSCSGTRQVLVTETVLSMPPGSFLGYPADACFSGSEEVLVLDQSLAMVHVFNRSTGEYAGAFGGPGDGPGEMGNPMSITVLGDSVLIRDQVKNGYLVYGTDHGFAGEVGHWSRSAPMNFRGTGNGVFTASRIELVPGQAGIDAVRTASVYRTGFRDPLHELYRDTIEVDVENIASLDRAREGVHTAVSSDGDVFVAVSSTDDYLIHVYDAEGNEEGQFDLEVEPVAKTQEEYRYQQEFMTSQLRAMGAEGFSQWEPLEHRTVIRNLGVHGEYLWVETGQYDFPRFNLHDLANGEVEGTVEFPRQGLWNFRIEEQGILAWAEDPEDGVFTVRILKLMPLNE